MDKEPQTRFHNEYTAQYQRDLLVIKNDNILRTDLEAFQCKIWLGKSVPQAQNYDNISYVYMTIISNVHEC